MPIHGVFSTDLHPIFRKSKIVTQIVEHFDIVPLVNVLIGSSYVILQRSGMDAKSLGPGLLDGLDVIPPEPETGVFPVRRLYFVIT